MKAPLEVGLAIERTYPMKLKLPHGEIFLDSELPFETRKQEVDKLLASKIVFQSETMTVEEYFRHTWEKSPTKTCMDMIGYYLTKNNRSEEELEADKKEDDKNYKEDKYVLSNKKTKEMQKGSYRHTTFSSMGIEYQTMMGIDDIDDSNYS